MAATRRMVKITKEMASVKVLNLGVTVGDVTSLDAIIGQGDDRGQRWTIYQLANGQTLDVSASTSSESPWVRITLRSGLTQAIIWERRG